LRSASPPILPTIEEKRRAEPTRRHEGIFRLINPRLTRRIKPMSVDYHSFTTRTTYPRPGFGTAHAGPEWSTAVRALRAAISAARVNAPYRVKPTGDAIAEAVINHVDELNARDRVVLAAILGIFFRKANGN
jgi:hypothetical protein